MTSLPSIRYDVELHDGSRRVRLRSADMNQTNLSNIFGLVPQSISLINVDGDVETADESGCFPVGELEYFTV